MGKGTFKIILLDVDDGVKGSAVAVQVSVQEIEQAVLRLDLLTLEYDCEAVIQEGVVP